jgi:DNA polymerase III subunit alpha
MPEHVELHLHSDYSTLDGACRIDRVLERATQLGMKSLALTDHGVMYGLMEFQSAAKKCGIKPLLGCELYLTLGSNRARSPGETFHMGVLCQSAEGYKNLVALSSDAHVNGFYYKPRCDIEHLAQHAKGLIGFTGCMQGVVPQHLLRGDYAGARERLAQFVDIFGRERFFVELQNHGIAEQIGMQKDLLRLAREFDLRVVATNDVHYIRAEDAPAHDALLCIGTGKNISDRDRLRYVEAFHLKSGDEMAALFPETPEALANTLLVAEMIDCTVKTGGNHFPVFPMPKEIKLTSAELLHSLCVTGLKERYGIDYEVECSAPSSARVRDIITRFDYEMATIKSTGFVDYFLVVQDFIVWAKQQGIAVGPGRGSGAGCLVAYLTKITNLDPLEYNLFFERFLNPERVSPPDFDIDFCMRRRGEVIEYVRQKYGKDHVANIITFGVLGPRSLMRDLARVSGLPYADGDRLSKRIPDDASTIDDALKRSSEFAALANSDAASRKIIAHARTLEGLVRQTGKHAAGIVIAPEEVSHFLPVTLQEGDLTTQYDMGWVDKLGMLKMDFLGLRTLTVIQDAVEHIRLTGHPDFDIDGIPLNDCATFALLNRCEAIGVFQMESNGIQSLARQLQVSSIAELIALLALYRPGPMALIPDFIRGKKDPSTVKYPHPLLEPVCRETYGVMVYQEQVMEAAKVLAGYTLGGADMLRRAMGKKIREEMEKQRAVFVEGCAKSNCIDAQTANSIFDLLEKFAGYGFNKSHSAAYGLLTYQTAYLKANHPVEFMAAVLTSELGNAEKLALFVQEARATMKIAVLGPDINESRQSFTPLPQQNCIRFGLAGVKGVGEEAARAIITEREARGPYRSLDDLLERVDLRQVNRRVLEALIKSGGFIQLHASRGALVERLESALNSGSAKARDRAAGQGSFLEMLGDVSAPPPVVENETAKEFSAIDLLEFERDLLGYYLSGHPMDRYLGVDRFIDTSPLTDLANAADKFEFRLCGIVLGVEQKLSKKNNAPWAAFTLATASGNINAHLYSNAYPEFSRHLMDGKAVLVQGEILRSEDGVRHHIREIYDLEVAVPSIVAGLEISVKDDRHDLEDLAKLVRDLVTQGEVGATSIGIVGLSEEAGVSFPRVRDWRFSLPSYGRLKAHPAVAAIDLSCKRLRFRPRQRVA